MTTRRKTKRETPITAIAKSQRPCFFVSPHYDDAVFSAGLVIGELRKTNPITIVTVFSEASDSRQTLSARAYLKQTGFQKASDLYRQRQSEDEQAAKLLNVTSISLGFTEVLWRKKTNQTPLLRLLGAIIPEFNHIYPIYRLAIKHGHLSKLDKATACQVAGKLGKLIPPNAVVFCPIGIGNHMDHLLVRDVCTSTFEDIIYWSDFPYNQQSGHDNAFIQVHCLGGFTYTSQSETKLQAMLAYQSQIKPMFGGIIPKADEQFYLAKTLSVW